MTDKEILIKYCKENNFELEDSNHVKETLGFTVYVFTFRVNELREQFKESIKYNNWIWRKYLLYKFDRTVIFKTRYKNTVDKKPTN